MVALKRAESSVLCVCVCLGTLTTKWSDPARALRLSLECFRLSLIFRFPLRFMLLAFVVIFMRCIALSDDCLFR